MRKKKVPEAVTMNGSFYVEINAVRATIKKIGKKFIERRDEAFNESLQELLDHGYDVNVRNAKKAFKAEADAFDSLVKIIDEVLKSAAKETITEDNKVKE